jgi:UrcA family protein
VKNFSKRDFISPLSGVVTVLALATAVPAGAQQADPRHMEETKVTATSNQIIQGTPRIWGAGVGHRAVTVSYADLNLNNQAGIDTLYVRLEGASKEVCSPRADFRNRAMHRDWQACYGHALDTAVEQVGDFALQEYHLAKTGRDVSDLEQVADR